MPVGNWPGAYAVNNCEKFCHKCLVHTLDCCDSLNYFETDQACQMQVNFDSHFRQQCARVARLVKLSYLLMHVQILATQSKSTLSRQQGCHSLLAADALLAAMICVAALCPVSIAACMQGLMAAWVASPAKNTVVPIGSARTSLSPTCAWRVGYV